ncbi:hypothetical protein TRFO_31295 [Tritrichomonas foetus]|uniref:Rad60/SUMO-like domain-containing protein n=1 Tax=Tritrichomonas foetus TaxID=1144522 RepID=A0A1J4JW38_9EUKA|nr:hypothetical protein TRFO_31295 [Tritrichomonas foetus]|eukprot:OHT01742.1 hypothetical protein TRFO_31295 [Tritrichomonas foetus]
MDVYSPPYLDDNEIHNSIDAKSPLDITLRYQNIDNYRLIEPDVKFESLFQSFCEPYGGYSEEWKFYRNHVEIKSDQTPEEINLTNFEIIQVCRKEFVIVNLDGFINELSQCKFSPYQKFEKIFQKLCSKVGADREFYHFRFGSVELLDSMTPSDYQMKSGDTIYVERTAQTSPFHSQEAKKFSIDVELQGIIHSKRIGPKHKLKVPLTTLCKRLGINEDHVTFFSKGEIIDLEKSLEESGIDDGSVIKGIMKEKPVEQKKVEIIDGKVSFIVRIVGKKDYKIKMEPNKPIGVAFRNLCQALKLNYYQYKVNAVHPDGTKTELLMYETPEASGILTGSYIEIVKRIL